MGRLRHVDPGGADITVRFRDKRIDLRGHSLHFARVLLGERDYRLLLEALDDDIARYGGVIGVVEELADHAFRGEWRSHLFSSQTADAVKISHTVLMGAAPDVALRVLVEFSARLSYREARLSYRELAYRRRSGAALVYEAQIEASGDLIAPRESRGRGLELAGAFLRELAGVFGEPALADMLTAPSPVVLYTNRSLFRIRGGGRVDAGA
jgi:hypothetical protein